MSNQSESSNAYFLAQKSISMLKTSVLIILEQAGNKGLRNVDIGKKLGIYTVHKGHEGHIPRAILDIMEKDGTVEQDEESKIWRLV